MQERRERSGKFRLHAFGDAMQAANVLMHAAQRIRTPTADAQVAQLGFCLDQAVAQALQQLRETGVCGGCGHQQFLRAWKTARVPAV